LRVLVCFVLLCFSPARLAGFSYDYEFDFNNFEVGQSMAGIPSSTRGVAYSTVIPLYNAILRLSYYQCIFTRTGNGNGFSLFTFALLQLPAPFLCKYSKKASFFPLIWLLLPPLPFLFLSSFLS